MKIDLSKPLKTRDGRKVTILSTMGRGQRSIVGYIGESEYITQWQPDGLLSNSRRNHVEDLIQSCCLWINIYEHDGQGPVAFGFPSQERALAARGSDCIGSFVTNVQLGQFDA